MRIFGTRVHWPVTDDRLRMGKRTLLCLKYSNYAIQEKEKVSLLTFKGEVFSIPFF